MIVTVGLNIFFIPMLLAESLHSGIFLSIGFGMCTFLTVPDFSAVIGNDVVKWEDARSSWGFTIIASIFLAFGIGTIQVTTYSASLIVLIFLSFILLTILTSTSTIIFTARYKAYEGDPREHHRIHVGLINYVPQFASIFFLSYLTLFTPVDLLLPEFGRWVIFLVLSVLLFFNTLDPEKDASFRVFFGSVLALYVFFTILFLIKPPHSSTPIGIDVMGIFTWIELGINAAIVFGSAYKYIREK